MSLAVLDFAKSFEARRLIIEVFSEGYIELWKIGRHRNILQLDKPMLSECLSSYFSLISV